MARRIYGSPFIFDANGTIDMTLSQNGSLTDAEIAEWDAWWEENGEDVEYGSWPDFDINDSTTWPPTFDMGDSTTWDQLTD
ncbi:MAG: hypothetical protein IKF46_04825 [Erysipelotrichaceae bacterium]|nr:hypothetical protein [Erysipelotrichaceae bacterium]